MAAKRRVLMIGGPYDGRWRDHHEPGHEMRALRPPRLDMANVFKPEAEQDLSVGFPDMDVYFLEQIKLYGEGIWVGLHKDTMYEMDRSPDRGWRDAHTIMILRAILQRDVATEMGL